jgi:hypothetical protein
VVSKFLKPRFPPPPPPRLTTHGAGAPSRLSILLFVSSFSSGLCYYRLCCFTRLLNILTLFLLRSTRFLQLSTISLSQSSVKELDLFSSYTHCCGSKRSSCAQSLDKLLTSCNNEFTSVSAYRIRLWFNARWSVEPFGSYSVSYVISCSLRRPLFLLLILATACLARCPTLIFFLSCYLVVCTSAHSDRT